MESKVLPLQEQYNEFLHEVLGERLFESGMNINELLVERFSVSPENARQIIKRAVTQRIIKSSSPYTFGKKQYIYIYNEHILDADSVKLICKTSRPPIYRLLEYMDINQGIISFYEALKITGSPIEKSSTKVSALEDILNLLRKLDIIYEKRDPNDVVYIILKLNKELLAEPVERELMNSQFGKMAMDCSVLPDILRWLGQANLINNSTPIYRNKKTPAIGAKHNNLTWDALAYTKATGINHILGSKADTIEKQTLVVLDVVLSEEYSDLHLDGFYSRIQINRNSVTGTERKVLPIIIYKACVEHTLNKINKLGFIAFDIGAIFGTRIYTILNRTQELSLFFKETEKIDEAIESILNTIDDAGQEDALKDLRGTLFEFLMYPLLSSLYPTAMIDRGKKLSRLNLDGKKEGYEYDYIIQSSNPPETIFVELKGYHSRATIPLGDKNTKASLKWFFQRTLPFAEKEYKQDIDKGKPAKAMYITSANFYEDGTRFIESLNKSRYKPLNLNVGYERSSLLQLLNERGFKNEIKIIEKFYTKDIEPLGEGTPIPLDISRI